MKDPRVQKLAESIVNYACAVKKGEKVLIETHGLDPFFIGEFVKAVYDAGGEPHVNVLVPYLERLLIERCTKEQMDLMFDVDAKRMQEMDAFIGIRFPENSFEFNGIPYDRMELYETHYAAKLHNDIRCTRTRWCTLRYPTPAMAQAAGMNLDEFEDFFFNVCNLDYARMSRAMDPLKKLMDKTDKVRITGKGTDLEFSIKNIGAVKCDGHCNIPDGEVYSSPVRDSVNGVITYNTPSLEGGFCFENIRFEFENGRIVKATANDTERLNKVLDVDEGARYVGEFAIGMNPYITRVMNETLFDEKIMGSIHFTPGNAIHDADNGNRSSVHWDLVFIQTPEFGGGEIIFDGEVIRKDGMFVREDLLALNPENLK